MRLRVANGNKDDARHLDGTSQAIVRVKMTTSSVGEGMFVLTSLQGVQIGGTLFRQESGDDEIVMDKYLQSFLKLKTGDEVDLIFQEFPSAQLIEFAVPAGFFDPDLKYKIMNRPIISNQVFHIPLLSGSMAPIRAKKIEPEEIAVATDATEISFFEENEISEEVVTYRDIGGLGAEIRRLRELVEFPLRRPEVFDSLGISQPRGVILYGSPRTGKTLLVKALAGEVGAKIFSVSGAEIFSKWYGESEANLKKIFEEAQKNAPAIILIDELDAIASPRDDSSNNLESRIVTTLSTLMDGMKSLKGVVVVGTTNRINKIDRSLRTPGRFEYEIGIGIPDQSGRREILEIHTRRVPLADDVNLDEIAASCHGFVGGDIVSLVREAAYNYLRGKFSTEDFERGLVKVADDAVVTHKDFLEAMKTIAPSAIREFLVEVPRVKWEEIGGLEEIKKLLIENIIYSITRKDAFEAANIKPSRGVLLYGPPGTGKTLLAKAVATESQANFISVKGPEIRVHWFGKSEEKIRELFAKAREVSPCIIFFDEIDSIAPHRGHNESGATDSIVNQLLTEMSGIESSSGVFVLAATNRVELIDSALLRPERFDYQIKVPLPDKSSRIKIFSIHLKGKPLARNINYEKLYELTEGFSGADIAEFCRRSALEAMREVDFVATRILIEMRHCMQAFETLKKTIEETQSHTIGFGTLSQKKK